MGVQHGFHIGTAAIHGLMKRQFYRRLMRPNHLAVRRDAHDVLTAQTPFVNAAGRDPNIAVLVENREIAAGSGRHAVSVDALHHHDELVCGVQQFKFHRNGLN